ncbi:hypothetical protein AB0H77_15635 [Streptomyces sp. NPDC050844]|uniref:hypothetical protein n=1 Tax=Streptomyces sp. NPDC050844 TaxID=3155790 RepID=UPI0033C4D21C
MTALPPGIYRIRIDNQQYLSRAEQVPVTLLPAHEGPDQEFMVRGTTEGNYAITKPSQSFPSTYLCYDERSGKPEEGARVVMRVSDFPPCEWRIAQGAGPGTFTLAVAGSDLAIGIGPQKIYPPFLDLKSSSGEHLGWTFEHIRDE